MSLYLHCVFHGIRFKVNGRLVVGMTINFFYTPTQAPYPQCKAWHPYDNIPPRHAAIPRKKGIEAPPFFKPPTLLKTETKP